MSFYPCFGVIGNRVLAFPSQLLIEILLVSQYDIFLMFKTKGRQANEIGKPLPKLSDSMSNQTES